jgi:hypothetical protein
MTTLFTNTVHCFKKLENHILTALGKEELQQAPNKNVLSPHLMLMSGLTIFFILDSYYFQFYTQTEPL